MEFNATFEILRRLNFTARNSGGIEFRGVNFNGTAMEFYRDAGFWRGSKILSRLGILHGATRCAKALEFYRGLGFCHSAKFRVKAKF